MKTNIIEERLLAKELERIQAEIARGMTIVNAVLSDLPRACTAKDSQEEARWIVALFQHHLSYKTGTHKHQITTPLAKDFPSSMRERILKQVVEVFLDEVEAMQEITSNLE